MKTRIRKITPFEATVISFAARNQCAPAESLRKYLSPHVAELVYSAKKRKASRTMKAIYKVAEQNRKSEECRIARK